MATRSAADIQAPDLAMILKDLAQKVEDLKLRDAVDIELNFKAANTDSNGVISIIVGKNTTETTLQIRIATRILPPPSNP